MVPAAEAASGTTAPNTAAAGTNTSPSPTVNTIGIGANAAGANSAGGGTASNTSGANARDHRVQNNLQPQSTNTGNVCQLVQSAAAARLAVQMGKDFQKGSSHDQLVCTL